jgi:hypothetical protein
MEKCKSQIDCVFCMKITQYCLMKRVIYDCIILSVLNLI